MQHSDSSYQDTTLAIVTLMGFSGTDTLIFVFMFLLSVVIGKVSRSVAQPAASRALVWIHICIDFIVLMPVGAVGFFPIAVKGSTFCATVSAATLFIASTTSSKARFINISIFFIVRVAFGAVGLLGITMPTFFRHISHI